MASREKKKSLRKDNLPNLKICVDNTEDVNSSSSESSEEGEISEDDRPLCVEGIKPVEPKSYLPKQPTINRKMASPVPSDEEEALTVDLDDLETFGVTKVPKKKYENKESGNFELGFDPTSKEYLEKREERAKRFGIQSTKVVPVTEENIKKLYESLGISRETKSERGIRLDAIHLRGCDDMNTNDVFAYFEPYAPSNIEWIDDSSCNIVWADDKSAARAMISMSDDPNVTDTQTDKPVASDQDKEEEGEEKMKEEEEKMEDSDPDELDLMSSDDEGDSKKGEKKRTKIPVKENVQEQTESEERMDTGEEKEINEKEDQKDDRTEEKKEKLERLKRAKRILPPGRWRVGHPLPKNQYLFMRFATKADKKLPGAERRGRYYQRYGNPNYGGGRGLISNSRMRRIRDERYREVEEEARRVMNQHNQSHDRRERQFFKNRRLRAWSSDEEEGDYEEEGPYQQDWHDDRRYDVMSRDARPQARLQDIEIKRTRHKDSEQEGEELDMEAELGELLRQIPEKRKMRMYADDEEDLIKRKRMFATTEVQEKKDLRSRLGNQGISHSNSRQARRRRQNRYERREHRHRSESPEFKYEKITIQVDPDDV